MSKLQVVTGGQYGSEAKGACTAFLARKAVESGTTAVVRVAGPNAGHTAYDDQGRKWALRQIPVAAVVHPDVELYIGAGSEIDFPVLLDEATRLEEAGIPVRNRLTIDAQATMIEDDHKIAEISGNQLVEKIGSTGKGIGAARADRLMRKALTVRDSAASLFGKFGFHTQADTWHELYHLALMPGTTVIIEGTQGYGLGLHAGHYPQCTSSDCRAIDFCAMAGLDQNWFDDYEVWVVARTYPIRVAGNSGPLKGETTWEALGFEPERTTVTQKIRRVGEWDGRLVRDAVLANGGPKVVRISLSMADYVVPGVKNADTAEMPRLVAQGDRYHGDLADLWDLIKKVEADAGAPVRLVGTGPQTFIEVG